MSAFTFLESSEASIAAAQVRVGVHVRIPLSWFKHSFKSASFLVTTEEEVQQIAGLGIDVFFDPKKSRVQPLPPAPAPAAAVAAAAVRVAVAGRVADPAPTLAAAGEPSKLTPSEERAAVMIAMRARLDVVQKSYTAAMEHTATAFGRLGAKPGESVDAISKIAEASMQALLSDVDSTLMLTNAKGGNHDEVAHAMSVMTLSLLLARQLQEPDSTVLAIGTGALLHDAGTGRLDRSIVRSSSRNKHQEISFRTHCKLGVDSLRAVAAAVTPEVLDVVLNHHEREDGSGYPAGKRGPAISRAARIVGIADRFDELTNPIDSWTALSPYEALAMMWSQERAGFDEQFLQHFIRAMGVYPPGTLVQLSDDRIAVAVTAAPPSSPMSPQVLVYDPATPRREAIIIDLALQASNVDGLKVAKALRMKDRSKTELDYLMPRRNVSWFHGGG